MMTINRREFLKRAMALGLSASSAMALLEACGGGSSNTTVSPPANPTTVAQTTTTITLFGGAGLQSLYQGLATAFHQKYPAITVNVKLEADTNYNTVLPRELNSSSAPDIAGPPSLVSYVKDNLLTNLDAFAKVYNWTSKVPSSILDPGRVNAHGIQGSGSLYEAGGNAGSAVGVFFNRKLATQIGLTAPPTSLPEFTTVLAKAKSAGLTPIVASNADYLIWHLHCLLLGYYMGIPATNNFIYHAPGASINTPQALAATTLLQQWIQAGYFNSDANAVNQTQSYGLFAGGKGVFMVQGSWLVPVLDPTFAGQYGFFPLPPPQAGGKYTSLSTDALSFAIPAKSQHKDAAALFLDWLTTPDADQIAVKNGFQTASATITTPAPLSSPVAEQLQAEYSVVAANDGFHSWQLNATPSLQTTWGAQIQLLFAGKTTPQNMLSQLQSTYESDLGSS